MRHPSKESGNLIPNPWLPTAEHLSRLRVAIVHPWFITRGGGERVVDAFATLFPQADIISPVARRALMSPITRDRTLKTSYLARLPLVDKYHRYTLVLQPLAIEQFDMSEYDLVLTSDSGPAKGVLASPKAVHVCYCHSPMRYIWDMYHQYKSSMNPLVRAIFGVTSHYIRMWDYEAAARVDHFVTNSHFVSTRVRRFYRRESTVIYPPVNVQAASLAEIQEDHYLSVGRLVPYKRVDLAIEACNRLGRPLRVIGDGPEYKHLKRIAGTSVTFLGEVNDQEVRENLARCRALLFPGEEDFGIVPVEANACGRPVIAYGVGGVLESLRSMPQGEGDGISPTGVLFQEQSADSLVNAILRFESRVEEFVPREIRNHAMQFDISVFLDRFTQFLLEVISPETEHGHSATALVATGARRNESGRLAQFQ